MDSTAPPPHSNLNATRRAAGAALAWERLWPRLLPLLAVIITFLAVSWLGFWPAMSDTARQVVLGAFAVAGLAALLPFASFRWPDRATVDTRIEARSALAHRPVTAQTDTMSATAQDPFAAALWREHRARMGATLSNLSPGTPNPQVAVRDPFALRAVLGFVLFIAAAAGFGEWGPRIGDAFRSHVVAEAIAKGRIDAWVTPPAYTNRPPVYLDLAQAVETGDPITARMPEGSTLIIRALDLDAPSLVRVEDGNERTIEQGEAAVPTYETTLDTAQPLILRSGTDDVATFDFDIVPDENPEITFAEDPAASTRGALEFSYSVADDYGVTGATAAIRSLQATSANAKPLVEAPALKLPLPRRRAKDGTARLSRDLTAHPWAGGDVAMTLTATDDAGQQGLSREIEFTLPQRVFTKPLARAVVYERRRLAIDIANRASVAEMLDIVTSTHPDEFIPNKAHYLALRMAHRMIDRERDVEPLREALDLLWDTALAIEDGNLSAAERRLRDAQEQLAEALENGASDEEIERLMQELREAMADFMREFAQNQQQNQQQNAMQNQNAETLRTQDLDEMMKRIEDLAKSGSKDAARELLREMQRMMNNLQMAQPQQGGEPDPMSEQMNKLGEMMREQQKLMDETFQMQQQQNGQQQQQQGEQGDQRQGQTPMTAEEFAEAMKQLQEQQGQLQQQMQDMQDAMKGLGVDPGEQLGEAGEAMGGAEQELGQGNTGEATGEQGRALQAMRQGAQQMLQNMQSQQGEQAGSPGERGQHGEQGRRERDPLGRRAGNQGPRIGDDVKVPGEIDAQRAREILDAIRKRLGETARPKLELDYLDRLLPTR